MKKEAARKILVATSTFAESDPAPIELLTREGYSVDINPYKRKLTKDELMKLLRKDVVGLIAGLETLDREVMESSGLKVISRCGSGLSNVDLAAAKELGVTVLSTPVAPVESVAEVTIGALLSIMRSLFHMSDAMRQKKWLKITGSQLQGKTVLVVGFGRIGRRVAYLLKAFGAHIIAADPAISDNVDGVQIVSLNDGLKIADIIALHSSGSKTILGEREFGMIKKGAYILNAARGELIDEKALMAALKSGALGGVWLDVFSQEPYSGELCGLDGVILTPHIGSYTSECRSAMELEATENLLSALKRGI